MKKKIIIPLICVAVICVGVGGFLLLKHNSYDKITSTETYPNNTHLSIGEWEMYVSSHSAENIYEQYLADQEKVSFTVTLKDTPYTIDLSDCYKTKLTEDDFSKLIDGISFSDYLTSSSFNFELKDAKNFDMDKATTKLKTLLETTDYKYVEPQDAYLDTKTYTIVKEVNGTKVDVNKALQSMTNALDNNTYSLNLDDDAYYTAAEVTAEDVEKEYADILKISKWSASYSVSDYVIRMSDYMDSVTFNEDGTYEIDTTLMTKAVLELSKTVDKQGAAREFKSTLDGTITVTGGTYGQCMSNADEITFLTEKLLAGESVADREPVWIVDPKSLGDGKTYVEIDLSAQHVWLYKDGKLIMETDCVTGTDNTSRATPTGSYYISEKVNGKYLIGSTWKTWVDKWMRLTGDGVGLHDASWRPLSEFGENTYKSNGSHGCINLPKTFAYDLYDQVKVGMLVVVHE